MLIAVVMVLSMVPVMTFAVDVRTVYLDPANGMDSNSGLTEQEPVQTIVAAYEALEGAQEGRIVLQSVLTLTVTTTFPTCDIPVTITGSGITASKSIFLAGDTTLENITLTLAADSNATYISSEGHDLTIGTGVTCKSDYSGKRFCLTTRYGEGSVDGATLTVKSGNWRSIYVAGYTKATTGNASLLMTGGNVNNMVAPTYSGSLTGNVTMQISGATVNAICCAPNQTGTVTGNVDITLGDGVSGKLRVKRLHENATVNGTATVTIDGDCTGLTSILDEGSGEGSIEKTKLVLKSGALDVTPTTTFDEVAVQIPQGKTMSLTDCNIYADTVNSAGTLVFAGSASLTAEAVTGSLSCEISDTPLAEHSYVTAPAGSAITFPEATGVKEKNGVWKLSDDIDTENFKGLVLYTTVDGITVELYKDFSTDAANLVTPAYTDGRYQYYTVASGDIFYGISKPTDPDDKTRYELHQTFYISDAEANKKVEFDMTPGVRSTAGWETVEAVCRFTDEVMQKAFPSNVALWPNYADVFTTPAFQPGRNEHRQTTQSELEAFLDDLDDPNDHVYVFNLGKTAVGSMNIPLVLVTSVKLPENVTLEEAAALIREDSEQNGKVTVHYQAQIHGDEPAAGEAALGMIKRLDGEYGETLLDNLNIYVIPRLNPYGAYKGKRVTWVKASVTADPNRDFLSLETTETQLRMQAFNMFDPEVVFDNHEYRFNLASKAVTKRDMMICSHILPTYSQLYKDTAIDLAYAAFDQLKSDNLTYSWYSSDAQNYSISSVSAGVGSGNTAFRGTMHILMETLGNNYGTNLYERRVASHTSAVTGLLNYLDTNAADVKAVVKAQRDTIVENGKTYKEDDVVILKTSANYHPEYNIEGSKVNLRNGGEVDFTFEARMTDTIVKSRIAPTAYVIPAGESYTQTVLDLMDKQGISYRFIPSGCAVQLQQYLGTVDGDTVGEVTLAEEAQVVFPEGAYVFCMNQVDSLILSVYMEPDVSYSSGLVKMGIVTPVDGEYPIYRYIHDLNEQGFIDYLEAPAAPTGLATVGATVIGGTGKITGLDPDKTYEYCAADATQFIPVAAGATEIADLPLGVYYVRHPAAADELAGASAVVTVSYALTEYAAYVDSANGSDDNDGYSQEKATKTFAQAQVQLDALMAYAPADTTGKICIVGTYEITVTSAYYKLPAHTYPLLITGGTLKYTNTSSSGGKYLRINGDTTFDNITLALGASGSAQFISGDGYKLVIGKNVTSKPYNTTYFGVQGGVGVYSQDSSAARGDITILSGHWQSVYAGGYVSKVTGDVRAVLSDCTVLRVTPAHLGTVGGDVYLELKNVTATEEIIGGTTGAAKNVSGNVTMVLHEGVACDSIYAGSRGTGNVVGTATVVVDGIDLDQNTIHGNSKSTGTIGGLALDLRQGKLANVVDSFVTRDGVSVKLGCDQTDAFALPYDISLDTNGCNVAMIDLNGNDLTCTGSGSVACKDSKTDDFDISDGVCGSITAGANVQAAPGYLAVTESGKTSFHKYEMALTNLIVNPTERGITYGSSFKGDQVVQAQIKEFGIAMRAYNAPNEMSIWSDPEHKTHVALTQADWHIGDNDDTIKSVYVSNIIDPKIDDDVNQARAAVDVYGRAYIQLLDGTMLFSQAEKFSMQSAMEHVDAWWNEGVLSNTAKEKILAFYRDEEYHGFMQKWNLPNIQSDAGENSGFTVKNN